MKEGNGNTPPFVCPNAASLTGKAADELLLLLVPLTTRFFWIQSRITRHALQTRVTAHENARWGVATTPLARQKKSSDSSKEAKFNKKNKANLKRIVPYTQTANSYLTRLFIGNLKWIIFEMNDIKIIVCMKIFIEFRMCCLEKMWQTHLDVFQLTL